MASTVDIIGDLYQPLLESLNVTANENGGLMVRSNDSTVHCAINKKNLLMPTNEVLKQLNNETSIAFHPLSENVARGDSSVQKYLTTQIIIQLTKRFIISADILMLLALEKRFHEKFKSSQMELFQALPEVDDKTRKNLNDVLTKIDLSKVKFINIYNKRNGKIDDISYNRVSVTTFPLLEEFKDYENSKLWGKIRKRDVEVYQRLFNYILPDWEIKDSYSGVSESMQAPSFQALIRAYIKVSKRFNKIHETYKSLFNKFDDLSIGNEIYANTDFEAAIENLAKYNNIIPPLDGNIGTTDVRAGNTVTPQPKGIPPQKAAPVSMPNLPAQQEIATNVNETPVYQQQQAQQPVNNGWNQAPVQQAPVNAPAQFLTGQYNAPVGYYHQQAAYQQPYAFAPQQAQTGQFLTGGYATPQGYGYQNPAPAAAPVSNDPVAQWNQTAVPGFGYQQPQGFAYPNPGFNAAPMGYGQPVQGYRPGFQFKAK